MPSLGAVVLDNRLEAPGNLGLEPCRLEVLWRRGQLPSAGVLNFEQARQRRMRRRVRSRAIRSPAPSQSSAPFHQTWPTAGIHAAEVLGCSSPATLLCSRAHCAVDQGQKRMSGAFLETHRGARDMRGRESALDPQFGRKKQFAREHVLGGQKQGTVCNRRLDIVTRPR